MTALPVINEATWARMGWRAQQQWLLSANRLRKQLIADVEARLATEHARAAFARGIAIDTATLMAGFPDDGRGEARLAAAVREAYDMPEEETPKPAAKNSRRLSIDTLAAILEERPHVTSQELAFEFRVTADGIRKACKRNERFDLLAQLRENGRAAA